MIATVHAIVSVLLPSLLPVIYNWILDKNWPIVLCMGATCSVTMREERGLRVFVENRVLRRMFKPNGDEIIRGCRN
jgi:hypothetical protein